MRRAEPSLERHRRLGPWPFDLPERQRRLALWLFAGSLAILAAGVPLARALFGAAGLADGPPPPVPILAGVLWGSATVIAGHELLHALAARVTSRKSRFGFRPAFGPYVEVRGRLTRAEAVLINLAPAVLGTLGLCLAAWAEPSFGWWAVLLTAVNWSASTADVANAVTLFLYPTGTLFVTGEGGDDGVWVET